jgi:hypothetical protein
MLSYQICPNLISGRVVCNGTYYKHENEAALDYQSIGANFCHSDEQGQTSRPEVKERINSN